MSLNRAYGELISSTPIGFPIMSLIDDLPDGFLVCNGAELNRITYSDLFEVIGTTYGDGDSSTTFNIPDARGYFPRFLDDGAGRDPNSGTRTARPDGASGDNVGTTQGNAVQSHDHRVRTGQLGFGVTVSAGLNFAGGQQPLTTATGGSETRPKNIALRCIIRVF